MAPLLPHCELTPALRALWTIACCTVGLTSASLARAEPLQSAQSARMQISVVVAGSCTVSHGAQRDAVLSVSCRGVSASTPNIETSEVVMLETGTGLAPFVITTVSF
jgi:hypothetical protein